jgi:hypothetical protein
VNVPLATFPQSPLRVRCTSDDDTTGSGHFFLPGSASDDHAYVVTAGVSAYHRSTHLRDTSSRHFAQSTGVFTASDVHYTEGRRFGTGGPLPSSDQGADLISTCLRHRSSCSRGYYSSRGHSDSNFRHQVDYSSTSSTSSGSGSFLSDLVSSQRGGRRRQHFRLLCVTFESCLYFTAGSFLSASGLVSFLVLVAKGGDR